jgi:sugar phosphate isomerase/epimerase
VLKLGIFAKTFDGTTPRVVLAAARRAGYDAVQYNMACSGLSPLPLAISDEIAEAVAAASTETGVEIASVSATYNMIHPNQGERERGRRGFEAIAAAAGPMGTRLLTLCTGTCDPEDQWRYHPGNSSRAAWDELCKEFHLLLVIADRHDLLLGVEPELANVVNSAQRARELLDVLNSGRVRVVLDPANLFEVADADRRRRLIEEAIELLGDSIALAHAKDRLPDGRFTFAGAGVLDYGHFLSVLRQYGYRGCLIAHGFRAGEAEGIARFLKSKMEAGGEPATHGAR